MGEGSLMRPTSSYGFSSSSPPSLCPRIPLGGERSITELGAASPPPAGRRSVFPSAFLRTAQLGARHSVRFLVLLGEGRKGARDPFLSFFAWLIFLDCVEYEGSRAERVSVCVCV